MLETFMYTLGDGFLTGSHPVLEAYAVVTAIVPILGTLIVTVVCAALFVVMLAFGLSVTGRMVHSAVLFTVIFGLVVAFRRLGLALRRKLRPPPVVSLASVGDVGWAARDVGHKAANLARFAAAGARVAAGWVVTADTFDRFLLANGLDASGQDSTGFAERIRAAKVPRKLLRELERTLVASAGRQFLLRSSFLDEDRGDRAFPGVYESVPWDVESGRQGLATALKDVWASYWSERAVEYRGTAGPGPEPLKRLAVLVNARLPHDDLGFGSSADVRTGFTERHLVEVATEGRECTGMHSLLPNVVSELASSPGASLDPGFVKEISVLAGRAEIFLGRHVEIEWGTKDGRTYVYQVRPLTSLPRRHTFTNSYLADTPRYPLTPLAWWFVFGNEPPARVLSSGLARLGLGSLSENDVLIHRGVLYLGWERFKPLFVDPQLTDVPLRTSLRVLARLTRTWLRGARTIRTPPVPSPPPPGLDARALLLRFEAMRADRLVPLTRAQAIEVQAAAVVDGLLRQIAGPGRVPPAHVETPLEKLRAHIRDQARKGVVEKNTEELIRSVWYLSDREAELSALRAIDFPEAFLLRLGLAADSPRSGMAADEAVAPPSEAPMVRGFRWLVALRDRLLTEREQINVRINALDYEARLVAEALSARIAEQFSDWRRDDVFFLTPPELRELIDSRIDPVSIDHRLRQRRAVHARNSSFDHPDIVHVDDRRQVVEEPPLLLGPDLLTVGIPLGGGVVRGTARVLRTGDWVPPETAAGQVVILPDPSAIWTAVAANAAAVLFARGGPLSHLAIWCRERRIPTIVAPRQIYDLVKDGDPLVIDADRGEVRRA